MKIFKLINNVMLLLVVLLLILTFNFCFVSKKTYAESSSSEIVIETSSNRILHEKNANNKMFMASTTKILTAITVIENCNLNDVITVTKDTTGIEGSSIYLEEGEKLTVKDLLYGLMLRSGNDCAETLAVHCSNDIESFAKLMNKTAQNIGAINSNFVNPHGLHDDNHYTTAHDLALISSYAMKNDDFREIVSTKVVDITSNKEGKFRRLVNKNKMLKEFEGSTGIKTGYTKKAGRCLVSSCIRNGMELICVVLNCPPMFERSKVLLSQCFEKYRLYDVIKNENIFDFIPIENSNTLCGLTLKSDVSYPLTEYEYENLKIECDYPKILRKPVKKDQEIGLVKFYCENNLLFTKKIYTILEIK